MTKIEIFNQAKRELEDLTRFYESCSKGNCDKFGATLQIKDSHIGFYGSSSCHEWSDLIKKAIAAEVQSRWKEMIKHAINTAQAKVKKAASEAKEEADSVLSQLTNQHEARQ